VNDTIDAVGFDFIQVPQVETEYKIASPKEKTLLNQKIKECVIEIKNFKSRTLTKSPEEFENYETLSMVMVDYNYDGKVFDLDEVFYADKLKPDFEVRFDSRKLDKQMMVIYLDIYGNEKKEILSLQDFKK
jgi:site-specific DNA-methyltransferase (adenine-specific)/adenine-specific DNA-methyltransferase